MPVIRNTPSSSTSQQSGPPKLPKGQPAATQAAGHAVQIVTVSDDHKFHLNVSALSSILLKDSVRHRPVVLLSIAGDFRKGKSFLLNHILRYLQAGDDEAAKKAVFNIGSAPFNNLPLNGGFHWRPGAERDTTGILMWSEPFVIKKKIPVSGVQTRSTSGFKTEEVAVLLMDTQGAFDSEYTLKHSATVFALATLTSSLLIFNLRHNLQENNLNVLDAFADYGRLATEATPISDTASMRQLEGGPRAPKPFQRLLFLIRDWPYPYEYAYGFEGGSRLLAANLQPKPAMPEQLLRVRRRLVDSFETLQCFLMPHPGAKVAASSTFDGRLADYDPDFLTSLSDLIQGLFEPPESKLRPKRIGGRPVTGAALLEYFKAYAELLEGDTMPAPRTMFEATAEVNNLTAVSAVQDIYQERLETLAGAGAPYMRPSLLAQRNTALEAECLATFDALPKMGGPSYSVPYRERLCESMHHLYEQYEALNGRKNFFTQVGVPLIMFIGAFAFNILAQLSDGLGLRMFPEVFHLIGYILAVLLIGYAVARFTGSWPVFILSVEKLMECTMKQVAGYVAQNFFFRNNILQQVEPEVRGEQRAHSVGSQRGSRGSRTATIRRSLSVTPTD